MSKHEKQVRRERKKTDRARRFMARFRHPLSSPLCGSHIPHGAAAALAAAAVIAAGTQAYAVPVRFDNLPPGPGHFDWTAAAGQDVLDVLSDAPSQPGNLSVPGTFGISSYYGRVVRGGNSSGMQIMTPSGYNFLAGVDSGVAIPTAGFSEFTMPTAPAYIYSTYPSAPTTSLLPEGEQTYLGVRFDQGGGYQYGWIGVVRTGIELDAFAWGYETTPGVPIEAGVPEPNTLALLAFGALAAIRKRRTA